MNQFWLNGHREKLLYLLLIIFIQVIHRGLAQKKFLEPEILEGPTNATAFTESFHTFVCRIKGSNLTIVWQYKTSSNVTWGDFVESDDCKVITVKSGKYMKNSTLVFGKVSAKHARFYRCAVRNTTKSTVSSTVSLVVHEHAKIVTGPTSQVAQWGDEVTMTCEVTGIPLPLRTWYQDNQQVYNGEDVVTSATLTLKANQSCIITCQAHNTHFNGSTTVTAQAKLTVNDGVCVSVQNIKCLPHLTYQSVYSPLSQSHQLTSTNVMINKIIDTYHNDSLLYINSSLSPAFISFNTKSSSFLYSLCSKHLRSILCQYSNPYCKEDKHQTIYNIPLCRESCLMVEQVFCGRWWHANNISSYVNCSSLPSKRLNQPCVFPQMFSSKNYTDLCYENDGEFYNGTIDRTSSGKLCQKWQEQYPHTHSFFSSFMPHMNNNYCRNPGGLRERPWCFTTDARVVWQYCDVPHCGLIDKERLVSEKEKLLNSVDFGLALQVFAYLVGLVFTVLIFVFGLVCLLKRGKRRKKALNGVESMALASISLTRISSTNFKSDPSLLDRNSVVYVEDIANGAFGLVFKAYLLLDSRQNDLVNKNEYVAIKMLKQDSNEVTKMEFLRQASIMNNFKHANILKLLGVCFVGDPYWIAVEYMEKGDLRSYLPDLKKLTPETCFFHQLTISRQIASALQYFRQHRFLHRDLAARNFLVASNLPDATPLTKLSDFTFTIELQAGKKVYVGMEDEAIAVRWAAPEAIQKGFFTFASDIWSFGVVLWEIFSFSAQPYQEFYQFEEISKYVRRGNILSDPTPNHPEIYRLVKKCWSLTAEVRCHIDDLLFELTQLQNHYQVS